MIRRTVEALRGFFAVIAASTVVAIGLAIALFGSVILSAAGFILFVLFAISAVAVGLFQEMSDKKKP